MDRPQPLFPVDTYDEREMFGARYPLVSAFPTPAAVAALVPGFEPSAALPPHHGIRRQSPEPWRPDNCCVVPIPPELRDAHAAEVAEVCAQPPPRTPPEARYPLAPVEEYREASLALIGGYCRTDPETWAGVVAGLDTSDFILLVEETADWCAWNPMIRFVSGLRSMHDHHWLRAAEHRLRLIARRLLDAQGFGAVAVNDTLAHPPGYQRGIYAVLR